MSFNLKQFLILAGLLVVTILLVIPLGRAVSSLSNSYDNLQSAKFRADKIKTSHQSLSETLIHAQTSFQELSTNIRTQNLTELESPNQVQNFLSECVRKAGGQIDSLRPIKLNNTNSRGKEEDIIQSQLNIITFEMRWRGSETQIKNCLADLIKGGPALQVETLDLNQPYGLNSPLTVTMRITALLNSGTGS